MNAIDDNLYWCPGLLPFNPTVRFLATAVESGFHPEPPCGSGIARVYGLRGSCPLVELVDSLLQRRRVFFHLVILAGLAGGPRVDCLLLR